MKQQLHALQIFSFSCFLSLVLRAQISPLPPLNTHPVWEVQIFSQTGEILFDTLTYGQHYCRCGDDYVAVVLNGEEEVLYLRQTEEKAFYLLDIDDCSSERLLYDYSFDIVQIPVKNILGITDSFDLFTFNVTPFDTVGILQLPYSRLDFTYQLGPFSISAQGAWLRGVGDIIHPFFPLFNNYNDSAQEFYYGLNRLTVDHLVWYEAIPQEPTNNIIYVDQDATGGEQDGSSWQDAFTNLDAALQLADYGDLIWVAEGVYTPGNGIERGSSFELRDGIQLYGGFNATETYLSERDDPIMYPTVLSGDIGMFGDSTDNVYHVLRLQDIRDFAVVDGFTIRDGNALGGNIAFPFNQNGAGILIYSGLPHVNMSSIVLKNNVLTQHTAFNGGAISLDNNFAMPLRLSINQSTISDNYVLQQGGGLFLPSSLTQPLDVMVNDTEFRANRFRSGGGGAIFDYHALTNWQVINTVFTENGSVVGGGGGAWGLFQTQGNKAIQILGCEFSDNYCVGEGAGLEYYHDGSPAHLSLDIEKTIFSNNMSFANAGGGMFLFGGFHFTVDFSAIECEFLSNNSVPRGGAFATRLDGDEGDGFFNFDRCIFRNNQSLSSLGGAIDAVVSTPIAPLTPGRTISINFRNSLFEGNKGVISQELYSLKAGILDSFINCTLIDNGPIVFGKPYSPNFDGDFRSNIYLKNAIIWEPYLPLWQILYNGDPEDLSVYDYELHHSLISVDSCDLPGGQEACLTFPNFFNINPQFVDVENEDYRLKNCSPLLNQGFNFPSLGRVDLGGNPRILEDVVDLGAYETSSFSAGTLTGNTQLDCAFDSTGSLSVNPINITFPINYTLIGQNTTINNSSGQFDLLTSGDYQLILLDGQSCADTLEVIITAPSPVMIAATTEPFIPGQQGGSIQLDSIVGGTPPYELLFEGSTWDGMPVTNLAPGDYLISSIDAQGCEVDILVEVPLVNNLGSLGHEDIELLMSPNPLPTGSLLKIEFSATNHHYQLEIWSAIGKKIAEKLVLNNSLSEEIVMPPHPGMYLVILKNNSGQQVATRRVIVH